MKLTLQKATKIAIEVANQSTEKHKIGAVLYDNNQYITGYNHVHGVEVPTRKNKWSIHAEEMVIIKGSRIDINFKNSILVVIRIKNGNLRLSKPCSHCQKLIKKFEIPYIYYSSDPLHRKLSGNNFKSLKH